MTDNPILEEYKLCQRVIEHNDNHNTSLGAFIFGGSIAAAGIILASQCVTVQKWAIFALLSTVILIGLLAYISLTKKKSRIAQRRMMQIENDHYPLVTLQRQLYHYGGPSRFWIYATMIAGYILILWFGVWWFIQLQVCSAS